MRKVFRYGLGIFLFISLIAAQSQLSFAQKAQVTVTPHEIPVLRFDESWADPNFVPCKGMGAAATGKVRAIMIWQKMDFAHKKWISVNRVELITDYNFQHNPIAKIEYVDNNGKRQMKILQKPWFPTVRSGQDSTKSLVLPRRGTENGPSGQEGIMVSSSNPEITIHLTTQFPTDSGACVSSFQQKILLK